jgi:iron complex outermembrane recepter protein
MNQRIKRNWLGMAALTASIAAIPVSFVSAETEMEEVVVTGSFIKGTPKDAALPVDVLSRSDLEDVGNPSIVEMIRNMSVTSGNLGETNQFDARGGQANEGVSTVNLRGLGSSRTLVLINGKRHVSTESIGVDISAIPSIAIGRVEVLKDGAAALYGSDAIAGVVNFITRDNFEGLELKASYKNIEDSDGDTSIAGIYGKQIENFHFTVSAEYSERSELNVKDRDWALRPFSENPGGGYSGIGNPGTIYPTLGSTIIAGAKPDTQCAALGGQQDTSCRFPFIFFDNLIEDQETIKLFGEFTVDINDNLRFYMEGLYSDMNMDEWKTSPSYPPQSLVGADRVLQANHPGLIDYKAQNPDAFSDVDLTAAGIGVIPAEAQGAIVISRMLGVAGRNGKPESSYRDTETKRVAGGFEGSLSNGIDFDISASWSERLREIGGSDMYIERMAFALDGLGGPNCDQAANFAAGDFGTNGCEYYNPFSPAIQTSAVNGATNPQYNAAVANSDELINWMTAKPYSAARNELFVVDATFTAVTEISLGGGNLGWAAGVQWRSEEYEFTISDVSNRAITPCPFNDPTSIELGHVASLDCGDGGSGQLAFLAAGDNETTDRDTYAAFFEVALPLTDTFDIQIAGRYEDLGDSGDSFDPKIAVGWAITDSLKFRGSASTTFRGPPASFLSGTGTSLQYVVPAAAFKAIDTNGNPDLDPETAVALNFGVIFQTDAFFGSIDYWSFDFTDPFLIENSGQVVNSYISKGCADGGAGAETPDCLVLRERVSPEGTSAGALERVDVNIINGGDIKTSGIDVAANYSFNDVLAGELILGFNGTYVLEYDSEDFETYDGVKLADGGDFVGLLNVGTPFTPKPEFKGTFSAKWSNEAHNVVYNAIFVDEYDDARAGTLPNLKTVDDMVTHDIHYINNMFEDFTLSLSVINATDEDPSRAQSDLNYDPYTHSAFGRMIKVGVTWVPGFAN